MLSTFQKSKFDICSPEGVGRVVPIDCFDWFVDRFDLWFDYLSHLIDTSPFRYKTLFERACAQ